MTTRGPLSGAVLRHLRELSNAASGPIWSAKDEGVIVVGPDSGATLHVSSESGPAAAVDVELMAQARTYLPLLLDEIEHLRAR